MLKKLTIVFAAAAVLGSACAAAAQVAPAQVQQLAPGTRVRVSTIARDVQVETRDPSRRQWRIGTVREVTEQDLVLQTDPSRPDALETVPFGVIQELDVSRGRLNVGRGMRRGMVRGGLVGGVTAASFVGILALTEGDRTCDPTIDSCELFTPSARLKLGTAAAIIGGGLGGGALIGLAVGGRSRETWVPVARHLSVAPSVGRGTGVGLSFRI